MEDERIFIRFKMNLRPISRLIFYESNRISSSALENEAVILTLGDRYICEACNLELKGFSKLPWSDPNNIKLKEDESYKSTRYILLENVTDTYIQRGKLLIQIFITTLIGIFGGLILENRIKRFIG